MKFDKTLKWKRIVQFWTGEKNLVIIKKRINLLQNRRDSFNGLKSKEGNVDENTGTDWTKNEKILNINRHGEDKI